MDGRCISCEHMCDQCNLVRGKACTICHRVREAVPEDESKASYVRPLAS
jgi:hypothetical protein